MELLKHINRIKDSRCKLRDCYKSVRNLSCHECSRTMACLRSCVLRNCHGSSFTCEYKDTCVSFINYLRIKREFENGRTVKDDSKL